MHVNLAACKLSHSTSDSIRSSRVHVKDAISIAALNEVGQMIDAGMEERKRYEGASRNVIEADSVIPTRGKTSEHGGYVRARARF